MAFVAMIPVGQPKGEMLFVDVWKLNFGDDVCHSAPCSKDTYADFTYGFFGHMHLFPSTQEGIGPSSAAVEPCAAEPILVR